MPAGMPYSAEVKRAKRAKLALEAGREPGKMGRPPKSVRCVPRCVPMWSELPDDLLEMIGDELAMRDLRSMAVVGRSLRAAAACVVSAREAARRAEARRRAYAALKARRDAIAAAEMRRRSLEGSKVLVLMDARTSSARWVSARLQHYVPGATPSLSGVDSYYVLTLHEDGGTYPLEVWANEKDFDSHCCMCKVGSMCAHCGGAVAAVAPSYVVCELPEAGYVASRPSRRVPSV